MSSVKFFRTIVIASVVSERVQQKSQHCKENHWEERHGFNAPAAAQNHPCLKKEGGSERDQPANGHRRDANELGIELDGWAKQLPDSVVLERCFHLYYLRVVRSSTAGSALITILKTVISNDLGDAQVIVIENLPTAC